MLHSVTYVRITDGMATRICAAHLARQYKMYMRPSAASSDCEIVFYELRLLRQLGTPLLYFEFVNTVPEFVILHHQLVTPSLFYSVLYYIAKLRYSYYLSPTRHPTLLRYSFSAHQQRLQIARLYSPARHSTTLL